MAHELEASPSQLRSPLHLGTPNSRRLLRLRRMSEVRARAKAMENDVADVLIVDNPDEPHAQRILRAVRDEGHRAMRFNLTDLRAGRFHSDVCSVSLENECGRLAITERTKVWWRHGGSVDVSGLDPEEATLATDEGPYLLAGAILASGAELVDCPYAIYRAELKPFQLAVARRLGIPTPVTRITNDPKAARSFVSDQRSVAKPLSPGQGIAPFVAEVTRDDVAHVQSLPTMLQELIVSEADARVVVVGSQAWVWKRTREGHTIDWRAVDRSGDGFIAIADEVLGQLAVKMCVGLGLTTSVQDWLYSVDQPVFLESNAVGAWLFLRDSERLVVPALVRHLVH